MNTVILKEYPNYIIHSDGKIFNKTKKKCLNPTKRNKRLVVKLVNKDGIAKSISFPNVIALAHIPNPKDHPFVYHKDKNIENNSVENLKWISRTYLVSKTSKNRKHETVEVIQLSIDGKELKKYSSIQEAALESGCERTNISRVCNGQRKTCGGYIWKRNIPLNIKEKDLSLEWRVVQRFPRYEISANGQVYSYRAKRVLKQINQSTGYLYTSVGAGKKVPIHQLVAEAFIPNPDSLPFPNHLNGDPKDNRAENLEWSNNSGNIQHAYDNGLFPNIKKIVKCDIRGNDIQEYIHISSAVRDMNIDSRGIKKACNKRAQILYKGYLWRYKDSEPFTQEEIRGNLLPAYRPVTQSRDGEIINTHKDVRTASKDVSGLSSEIHRSCRLGRIYKGFKWEYSI